MKCLFAIARDLKARRGPTYDDIEAVRAWLIRQEGCTGKIGIIGFCMGAEFARELSPGRRALALAASLTTRKRGEYVSGERKRSGAI